MAHMVYADCPYTFPILVATPSVFNSNCLKPSVLLIAFVVILFRDNSARPELSPRRAPLRRIALLFNAFPTVCRISVASFVNLSFKAGANNLNHGSLLFLSHRNSARQAQSAFKNIRADVEFRRLSFHHGSPGIKDLCLNCLEIFIPLLCSLFFL